MPPPIYALIRNYLDPERFLLSKREIKRAVLMLNK